MANTHPERKEIHSMKDGNSEILEVLGCVLNRIAILHTEELAIAGISFYILCIDVLFRISILSLSLDFSQEMLSV